MPRFRVSTHSVDPSLLADLTNQLSSEINFRTDDGPLIFEREIPYTDTYHVIVVWQRWAFIPEELRNSIILDAYQRADPDFASKITIAVGVTMEEAIEMNLLPFQITSGGGKVVAEQLDDAIKREGAIYANGEWQLRFPTRELASEVLLHYATQFRVPHGELNNIWNNVAPTFFSSSRD